VNADCIMPYRFPIRIFGSLGTVFDNRIWSHKFPGQTDWVEMPAILPDSSDVRHHPFQGEIDHFVECLRNDRESHCNLEDAVKTHEVVFAALKSRETHRAIELPLV
jgi:predicted dehydrogenase